LITVKIKDMNRQYRIYDKSENAYCEEPDYRWLLTRKGKLYNSENDKYHIVGERYLIEFFTGLHDKHGKKVWEGDILSCEDAKVKIEFSGGQFVGINLDENHPIRETQNRNWLQWEVIGNIHEKQGA
jgi:hypothetical protein